MLFVYFFLQLQIFGAISLVLPAGCLIYDKTAVDTEKDAAAALLAAGPLSMEEAAAPSTAADAVTATATSTSSTTEAPTATEKETPKKEAEAQCFKVLLCFACPSLAQKWYKLLVHRLALVETSPPTIAAAANSSDASASSAAAPVVCDKTGTELAAPSESEDRLLGAFSLAQADPVLFRLEAQWLGLATDDMVSTAGRTAAAATTGVADLLTLPTSGLLLFKVLVVQESPPDELNNFNGPDDATALARMDSSTSQMKGWMSCWVRLDRAARTLTFFDQGPGSAPSLSVSCDRATLHVPDLTDPELGCECNLYHCTVRNTPIRAKMSLAIKLPSALELFKWVLALSAVLENVTYCSGGKVQPATQPIDYLQDAPYYPAYSMSAALSSSPSDFAATKPYMMEICMGALEALAERKMCSSYIRNVQLSGAQIKTARFLQMNQRIVLLMKGTCSTLTEGSVLLSVNGLSAVSTAASTVLKFIADFPKQMLGELTLWKFPRMEFQVDIVKLAVGAADIEEVKLSMRTNRPSSSSSSSDKTTLDVSVTSAAGGSNSLLASVDDAASQPLDAKGKLNKVIIQKRNSILKFNSGLEMSFEGVAYPSILANIQTELKSLDINNAATAAAAEGGAAGSASWSGSASLLQGAIGQESGGFTLADFTRCSPAEVKWKSCRLMVASGNISLLGTDDTGAEVALGRLQLTSCQLKLVCPTQATHVDHLAVHLRDAKSQVVIRCPSVPVFIDLVECLVISLKMMGAYPADLAHLYDQSVHWKTTQERLSGVSFSSTSSSSALAVSPRGGAASSPQQQSLSSRSASFRSQSLLMQSVVESSEAGGGNASGFLSAPQTPSAATSIYANTDEVPLALTSASSADPDASILQAAEELEDTLSQLHLPLNFPTHTVIEKEMVELFKQNNANHRLLAEFLTLQFEVMNPVPEGTAPASNARSKSFSFSTPTQPSIRAEEEDLDSAETKYPNMNPAAAGGAVGDDAGAEESGEGANLKDFPSSADMALRDKLVAALSGGDDDNGGSGSNGDSEKANTKESAATVSNSTADQPDRSEEAPETFKVVSPPSPKESGGTPPVVRRASVQMRSGSVMMGSAAPVTVVQSSANRRATFRKSAITHSQEQAAVLLMSQLEKQVLLQVISYCFYCFNENIFLSQFLIIGFFFVSYLLQLIIVYF